MNKLEYSTLLEPITAEDIKAYKAYLKSFMSPKSNAIGKFITRALTTAFILFFAITFIGAAADTGSLLGIVPSLVPFSIIVLVIYLASSHSVRRGAKLYKFAKANNIEYYPGGNPSEMDGFIFNSGHSRSIKDRFVFPDGTEVANYTYKTGSGKHQQIHIWSYVRLQLKRRVPHMILDSKGNNMFGRVSNLPTGFDKSQVLSLEGDFDNYFTLFAPREYETDALYIFTPDVMQALIEVDENNPYDMEAIDDHFYIYRHASFGSNRPHEWQNLAKVVDILKPKLNKQTHFYSDDNVGDRVANIIAEPGRRLQPNSFPILSVIIIIAVFIFVISMFISAFGS